MQSPEPNTAAREAIRHWSCLPELVEFATRRHGFGDSDGGFGVTYPGDIDEHDFAAGEHIPDGFVRVYGFWGPPGGYDMLMPEQSYLDSLAGVLSKAGHAAEAVRVRALSV